MGYARICCAYAGAALFLFALPSGADAQIITAVSKPTANSGPYKLADNIDVEGVLTSTSSADVPKSVKIELLDQNNANIDTDLTGTIKKDPVTDNYYTVTGKVRVNTTPFGTGTVNYKIKITFYSDAGRMTQLGPTADVTIKVQRTPYP